MKLDYYHIKSVFLKKGYAFFDGIKPYNLNIFGVRCDVDTNFYDDLICIAYRDSELIETVEIFQATTDAGEYWLLHPSNSQGTAILCEGQYRGVYKIDKHGGKYDALCQRISEVTVYRDSNKDGCYDLDDDNTQTGFFGINIHRATARKGKKSSQVDKWSAGCQVIADNDDWHEFLDICQVAREIHGNSFSYTLLESIDVI